MTDFRVNVIVDPSQAPRGIQVVDRHLTVVENRADSVRRKLSGLFAGLSTALLVRELAQAADAYTNLQNRLGTVTEGQRQLGIVTEEVFAIANRTRSAFDATAEVYARIGASAKELGRTQLQLLGFTESLNQAVVLSGASAQEASAGLIQLSQGLASGALRGDELRSVLEQLPEVADVIAKGLGVTRGELRLLGAEGKITADIVLDSFASARKELSERFAKTVPTISQSFVVLRNNFVQFVGELDQANGASAGVSRAIILLAENLDRAADAALLLGAGFAAIKLTPVIQSAALAATGFVKLQAAVLTGRAVTLGSVEATRQQAVADLQSAQAKAAQTATVLANTQAQLANAVVVRGSTEGEIAHAAITQQITLLQAENVVATNAATAAQVRLTAATKASALTQRVFFTAFKVNPFLILVAGAAAAVVALRKLDDVLDEISEAQAISEGGAKSGLTDFANVGADIVRIEKQIVSLQKTIDQDGLGNPAAISRLRSLTAELEKNRARQAALANDTDAARAAALKQRQALAEVNEEFTKSIAKLKLDAELLGLANREREVQAQLFQRVAAIEKDGAQLTPDQKGELEKLIRSNQSLSDRAEILDSLRGPQEAFEAKLATAKALLDENAISADEFNRVVAELAAGADGVNFDNIQLPGVDGGDLSGSVQNLNDLVAASRAATEAELVRQQVLRDIKGPIEDLFAREQAIEELHTQRKITDLEYATALAAVRSEIDSLANVSSEDKRARTLGEINAGLEEQERLLRLGSAARAVEVELLSIEQDLRARGLTLEPAERAALQTRLQQLTALERAGQILEDLRSPQEQFISDQQALAEAFRSGALSIFEYSAALELLRQKQDETAKSANAFGEFAKFGFQQAGSAIVEFAVTGEDRFKEFTASLLQDLGRLLAQKALVSLLDAFTGGGASAGTAFFGAFAKRAGGGDVESGVTYKVGEHGPELFTAPTDGQIIPAGETAAVLGSQQQAPIVNVSVPPAQVNITNVTDPDEVPSGIESEGGQQAVLNVIRKHKRTVRGITG